MLRKLSSIGCVCWLLPTRTVCAAVQCAVCTSRACKEAQCSVKTSQPAKLLALSVTKRRLRQAHPVPKELVGRARVGAADQLAHVQPLGPARLTAFTRSASLLGESRGSTQRRLHGLALLVVPAAQHFGREAAAAASRGKGRAAAQGGLARLAAFARAHGGQMHGESAAGRGREAGGVEHRSAATRGQRRMSGEARATRRVWAESRAAHVSSTIPLSSGSGCTLAAHFASASRAETTATRALTLARAWRARGSTERRLSLAMYSDTTSDTAAEPPRRADATKCCSLGTHSASHSALLLSLLRNARTCAAR